MGARDASFGLLLDVVSNVESFVTVFIIVYALLIFAYVIMSWVPIPYALSGVQGFLRDVCEPYLRLFRRVLPPLGPLDLSPFVAVMVRFAIERPVNAGIVERLH